LLESGFLQNPIVVVIEFKILSVECISEHSDYFLIIWPFLELKFSGVVQKVAKLFRIILAKVLDARGGLLDFDLFVIFVFVLGYL
jgi:hypothetical protein